jgi:hypothetical protein
MQAPPSLIGGDERDMEFTTSDLQLAAYLLVGGYPLLQVKGDSRRREFVFGQCPQAAVLAYYQGQDNVSARKLFSAYRDLKSLVFTQQHVK